MDPGGVFMSCRPVFGGAWGRARAHWSREKDKLGEETTQGKGGGWGRGVHMFLCCGFGGSSPT